MNAAFLKSVLRDSWYLFALLAIAAAAAVVQFSKSGGEEPEKSLPPLAHTTEDLSLASSSPLPQVSRPNEQEAARQRIAEYQQRVDADPKSADAPVLLNAMANLSRQKLGDYKEAARCYELILIDYPNWEMIAKVYPQLAVCYEHLGDIKNAQSTYKLMVERFPPESPEHQYAQVQLGVSNSVD